MQDWKGYCGQSGFGSVGVIACSPSSARVPTPAVFVIVNVTGVEDELHLQRSRVPPFELMPPGSTVASSLSGIDLADGVVGVSVLHAASAAIAIAAPARIVMERTVALLMW